MAKVKLLAFSVSLDGFGAGSDQDLNHPLGFRGEEAFKWMFETKRFAEMTGQTGGSEGVDNRFAEKSFDNIGSWIMGRNMFGPIRGDWPDNEWKGWWGEDPPFHTPVFVLTHYPRKSFEMKGGTVFHFVTDGIQSALEQAKEAASGKDIRIGGGVSTFRQFLQAGCLDEIHLALSPVFLGSGEHLFAGIDMSAFGFNQFQKTEGEHATHFVITKG
ncbi:MAG TPA: dihydrofolate reductase family protein [Puia sp.]|nr:dihydrofolate reductase family protein [Puia sp.]